MSTKYALIPIKKLEELKEAREEFFEELEKSNCQFMPLKLTEVAWYLVYRKFEVIEK